MTSWTVSEIWCVGCALLSACLVFLEMWRRQRVEERMHQQRYRAEAAERAAADAGARIKELEDEPEDEPTPVDGPIFAPGETVLASVSWGVRVKGKLVGAVGSDVDEDAALVVQFGATTFLVSPDDVTKSDEATVGYRDSARRDVN